MSNAIDDGCAPDIALRSTPLTGRVTYETKPPNAGYTDWGTPFQAAAQGFLVAVTRPDAMGNVQFIDAQITTNGNDASGGRFSVRVPAVMTDDDRLFILAVGVDSMRRLVYVVADPGHTASATEHPTDDIGANARIWSWNAVLNTLVDGDTIPIAIRNGSGAARVFDYARYVYGEAADYYRPSTPQSLVVWVGLDTQWSCGACYAPRPITKWSIPFLHQSWIAGGADEGYWSDAVTAHELGHYIMSAFGRSPGEGGPHRIGVPTHPGQAWSEGWATFYSSRVRASPIYYDKQDGGFFSVDIERRVYRSATSPPWQRPTLNGGLMQLMDENEVSAMLWSLSRDATGGAIEPFLTALGSSRMTVSPFARGYTRRIWSGIASSNYMRTTQSAPMVADMFDALVCGRAVTAAALDRVTEPTTRYPFPSDRPLCREGQSPIRAELHGPPEVPAPAVIELSIEVARDALFELPVDIQIALPTGTELVRGASQQRLSPEHAPLTSRVSWLVKVDHVPDDDITVTVGARGDGFTFHAPLRYRFGRSESTSPPLQFDTQQLLLRGANLGASIRVEPQRGTPAAHALNARH